MSQKYSINDILKAVDSINPENRSERKFANEEILGAIEELNKKKNYKIVKNIKKNEI